MTLAIAAEYPWGRWRDISDSMPGHFARSIIIAADTRWSIEKSSPVEVGRKIWTLGRQTGIVMAGDVWAGEEAVSRLRRDGKDALFKSDRDVVDMCEVMFRETYSLHLQKAKEGKRVPCHKLWFLVGFVDREGCTALARFASDADFRPIYLKGIHAIGVPSAITRVRQDLIARIGEPSKNSNLSPDPMDWAMHLANAISEVIASNSEPSVGGRVQMVIGTKDGWTEHALSSLAAGADAEDPGAWIDTTYPLAKLKHPRDVGFFRLAASEDQELETGALS
jgi:hypothetical protein